MAKSKKLNIVMTFGDTSLVINDLGETAATRFELYDTAAQKVLKKSNDPTTFYPTVYMDKKWRAKTDVK